MRTGQRRLVLRWMAWIMTAAGMLALLPSAAGLALAQQQGGGGAGNTGPGAQAPQAPVLARPQQDQGTTPPDNVPVTAPPVRAETLGNGLPHRDAGAPPGTGARTGADTTANTRLPPEGGGAPPQSGTTQPGASPALGRGS